jgi:hypothetical protein
VVVICEDLAKLGVTNTNTYHAIIQEGLDFETGSLLEACDICLKAIFVFNLCFPAAARSSWLFLQQAVMKLVTPKDAKNSRVSSFMSDVDAAIKKIQG